MSLIILAVTSFLAIVSAGTVPFVPAEGLGDLSNTAWSVDISLTPTVTTNNISGSDTVDPDKTDGVYAANGNANGFFSRSVSSDMFQVELGLRITNRYGPPAFTTGQTYSGFGSVEMPAATGWKVDWSVRTLDGSSSLADVLAAGGRFEMGFDIDPSDAGLNFQAYDPISFFERGGAGAIQIDSDTLSIDGTTVDGSLENSSTQAEFETALANSQGMQNSWQPRFDSAGNPLKNFLDAQNIDDQSGDCTACSFPQGRYEVYLIYSDSAGNVLARSSWSVFQDLSSNMGALNPQQQLNSLMPTE